MESKLLYDMYTLSIIEREEIISFMKNLEREKKAFENIDYYDILYSKKENEIEFINNLSQICYKELIEGELNKKYGVIITLFYKKKLHLNIKNALYNFFYYKSKSLLDIDFDFWNLIETDYELRRDGFEGISDSTTSIENYLNKNSKYKDFSIVDLIYILAKCN